MKEHKLTIRVSREVLDGAKRYAHEHGTNVTRLVTAYLEKLGKDGDSLASAPITRRLTGSLPPEASRAEFSEYLQRKHE